MFEVAVGWDPGLGTYFAIAFGIPTDDCDPDVLLYRGTSFGEIGDSGTLLGLVRGFAEVPPEVLNWLERDRCANPQTLGRPIKSVLTELMRSQQGRR